MPVSKEQLEADRQRRQETSDSIVESDASKKLIVAGPGTGKTHNFKRVLEAALGKGLALTFIRTLAADLEKDLGEIARVNTLHGYCKSLAHGLGGVGGLSAEFDYYPSLFSILADDLTSIRGQKVTKEYVDKLFHKMEDTDGLLSEALNLSLYYDALSHTDAVYRMVQHFEGASHEIPKHPVVVVDEYQDFSLLETRFVQNLAKASPILIAGDDDQALYRFKHASANFIRELAENEEYERFDLPYCSRCTEVVVQAINNVVGEAQKCGLLQNRLDREYLCYLPDKQEDSDNHPAIVHAACSVHMKKAPYIAEYVAEQIAAISTEDIKESKDKEYPTALVIGPSHFVKDVHGLLEGRFSNVSLHLSEQHSVDPLDGYRRIAENEKSSLGWRLVMEEAKFKDQKKILHESLVNRKSLADVIPDDYRKKQLEIAGIIGKLIEKEEISDEEEELLLRQIGVDLDEIRERLKVDDAEVEGEEETDKQTEPSIICTSLLGAKGLQAGHVFIVGFNDGGLPKNPSDISNDEVCKFLVGLSRTRKACHLVSCGRYAGKQSHPSTFLKWLSTPIEYRTINKEYWKARASAKGAELPVKG